MPKPSQDDPGRPDRGEIANVAGLFGDSSDEPSTPTSSRPAATPAGADGYDLADFDDPEPAAAPVSPIPEFAEAAPPQARPRRRPSGAEAEEENLQPSPVSQPWSRGGEWGGSLIIVGAALLAGLSTIFLTFSVDNLGMAFILLLLTLGATLIAAMPILVTLERPVRVTPEQALRDYFGSLSMWMPPYRRMWLLLSDRGKSSAEYGDFAAFRAFWKRRLAEIKAEAGGKGMLEYRLVDYKADKAVDKQAILAKYAVEVVRRGSAETPGETVAVFRGSSTLSKGPDRMWYLDDGTLPTQTGR